MAMHCTSHIEGMEGLDYWDRLRALNMFSQERRRERYFIIFVWKLAMGMVKGHRLDFVHSPRRGWLAVPKTICSTAPACVRKAREASLAVKGAALFNLCPRGLRDLASDHQDRFKCNLDAWLGSIPDQPTLSGQQRAALTNSLLDQVPMLVQQFDSSATSSQYLDISKMTTDNCYMTVFDILTLVDSYDWRALNVVL